MKRCLDILLALLALLALSPLLLLVAVCIAAQDGFPVLFRQIRIGQGGQEFAMFKFRSMVKNVDSQGPYFTVDGDPRITRLGRLIRRTSIDELPQLINVLLGDMSLVGPRPDVPVQRSLYTDADWQERCSVRPGITGLAQAMIRSEGGEGERLKLDLQYVRSHSVWLDLKIMVLTLKRLGGKGSN
jgi:lipopolysaccharide/colanic/teichoic acid biosynthesis glycosyltransferase